MRETTQAMRAKAPWDLSLMPNYAQARAVEVVQADQISPSQFQRRYVAQNRPCLVKGAARHWPGFERWRSQQYLREVTRNDTLKVRSTPQREFSGPGAQHNPQQHLGNQESVQEMPFHDFLQRAFHSPEQLVVHSIGLRQGGPFDGLLQDIGNYAFLPRRGKTRAYVPLRAFFYRNSYTDWHYHPADETLMTQVVGAKEVLLLPPDDESWQALHPVSCSKGYLYDIDLHQFPAVGRLVPYRAVVEAGDAMYIPVYWWHAVMAADEQFGVTVASAFATPLHVAGDLRYPFARQLFRGVLRSRLAPLGLAAVGYAYLYRLFSLLRRAPAAP